MTLIDSEQRLKATDPFSSFIVQAPAGSGKTEILTQRYLRLLGTVTAPEQIIALTFTRKAASEMRERIVIALQQASTEQEAKSAHQKMTLDYAKQALARSNQLQWNLLEQPNRLKINTIDSLCQQINQAIPLIEKHIAYSQITDKASKHYLHASRNCIQYAVENPEYQQAIKTLLLHVDNRQDNLIELFKTLLAQRDQWLGLLFQARAQEKGTFEQALRLIEQHGLNRFNDSLAEPLKTELIQLARELAAIENNPDSPRFLLRDCYDFAAINQETAAALAKLILTGENKFRNAFDHHVGLKRGVCPDEDFDRIKAASKKLLAQLSEQAEFYDALMQVSQLPDPEYDAEQWEVLQALFVLLPLLVGHLQLLFSEHNEVDFTAIAQQALEALGAADNPTDLALYLDNAIHHLLVDEFQDTSINQFELLTRLVQGWQTGDGKTLFVVGDPMQSIYRFRQAEVGLFFRAKEQGVAGVQLQSLELSCNFRSTQTIVEWVNSQFSTIFPPQVDIESGAVAFHASVNVINSDARSMVQALQFTNKTLEAESLVDKIRLELENEPEQSLAILVRSRSQLKEIIRLLRQHRIPYQGTDIDLLANLMHLRDAWSLTQALLSPANRLAWLALLRSPYCGLTLNDIHCIATFNKKKSLFSALEQLDQIQGLSEEGRTRARYFTQVMQKALANRYHASLTDWVLQTSKDLHSDKILNQSQLEDLEQFWALLDRYEADGRLPDSKDFQAELSKLYSQQATPSRLQVMTIHKSKGLEFDTVFLPGLGSPPNKGDNPMLRWLKLPTQNHDNLLLVSPVKASHQDRCDLYDYLGRIDEEKSQYEAQRLLYVAATRAKKRLYLLNSSTKTSQKSFHSLLKHQEFIEEMQTGNEEERAPSLPLLSKLPNQFYEQTLTNQPFLNAPGSKLTPSILRLTGIVAHQILQWICDNHPQSVDQIPWNLASNDYAKFGFDLATQAMALETLQEQISAIFKDAIGAWIIAPHAQEKNEYELLVASGDQIVTRIIDRSFEDQGILWIIDFKTGCDDEASLMNHKKQLNEYAYYLSSRTQLPIRCGLYYLQNTHWLNWHYEAHELSLSPL